jgi:peptide deformylase
MTVRDIVLYAENAAVLRQKSRPVRSVNHAARKLIKDLKETLETSPEGIGLAAPQINRHWRVVIVCLGVRNDEESEPDPPIALVNPVVVEAGKEERDFDGCLSFPGLYAETIRPHFLRVTGLAENGKTFDRLFTGFDAVVVHHEIDHLDGVLFIDRVARPEDLYRIQEDEHGRLLRVPATMSLR